MPKITLTTVCYNGGKTLGRTIESVLSQTFTDFEYLILDGLSNDNSLEIAKSYILDFEKKGVAYKIFSEKDRGMYDALNKGIELAEGIVIGNINSDDWLEPNALQIVSDTYDETQFDMFYADLRIIKSSGTIIKRSKKSRLIISRYWNHPTSYFTREILSNYKYACQNMYDDFDLWLRIMKDGNNKVVIKNTVLANFVFGGMSTKRSIEGTWNRCKLRMAIYKKNGYSKWYYLECFFVEFLKLVLA